MHVSFLLYFFVHNNGLIFEVCRIMFRRANDNAGNKVALLEHIWLHYVLLYEMPFWQCLRVKALG